MMEHGIYNDNVASPQTRSSVRSDGSLLQETIPALNAYVLNGEGIIESAEKIGKLQVFTVSGKMILERLDVIAPVRIPLSEGVNIIKVDTESESKTFKLVK